MLRIIVYVVFFIQNEVNLMGFQEQQQQIQNGKPTSKIDRVSEMKCKELIKPFFETYNPQQLIQEEEPEFVFSRVTTTTIEPQSTSEKESYNVTEAVATVTTKHQQMFKKNVTCQRTKKVRRSTEEEHETPDITTNPPTPEVYHVVGGMSAGVGEFPHMAAIGWENADGSYKFDCGGALISSRFVLTAAHCTYAHTADNPIPRVVRLGEQNIDSSVNDGAMPVQVTIKKIHKHPAYTRKKYYNDIALLELSTDVTYANNIQPVCMWTKDLDSLKWAIAIGWGVINPDTGERSNDLQKVDLSILNTTLCKVLLKGTISRKWDHGIEDSQLCAGEPEGGKDTCQGDSGSPLQIISDDFPYNYYVIGITSFGPRICARLPAIYTQVSSYLDWIESIVWPEEYKKYFDEINNNQNK